MTYITVVGLPVHLGLTIPQVKVDRWLFKQVYCTQNLSQCKKAQQF